MVSRNFNRQQAERSFVNASNGRQVLVSVIIPVRNRVEQIETALLSVLSQREGIAEVIVIDGASTDGTVDVILKYSDQLAYWVSEADQGIYDAMNKGIEHARGKYALFLVSYDVLTARLDELKSVLCDPSTIYYGNYRTIAGLACNGRVTSWRLAVQTINHQSIFYPIKAFDNGGYSTKYSVSGDWEFNIRCFGTKRLRFQHIPYEIAFYSRGGFSSQVTDTAFLEDRFSVIRQHLPFHAFVYARVRSFIARLLGRR